MAIWRQELILSKYIDEFHSGDLNIYELAGIVANKIEELEKILTEEEQHATKPNQLENIIAAFREIESCKDDQEVAPAELLDQFDSALIGLYDWGDLNVGNSAEKMCWIQTFG